MGIPWWSLHLGLCSFTAEGVDSIAGLGTKIPQALCHSQNKKTKNKKPVASCSNYVVSLRKLLYTLASPPSSLKQFSQRLSERLSPRLEVLRMSTE